MRLSRRRLAHHKKQNFLTRAARLIAGGTGNRSHAALYFDALAKDTARRYIEIAKLAESDTSWEFMRGAYKQAIDIYVTASLIYRKSDRVLLTDAAFDGLAKFLLSNFSLLDKDFLSSRGLSEDTFIAGTGVSSKSADHIEDTVNTLCIMLEGEGPNAKRKATKTGEGKPRTKRVSKDIAKRRRVHPRRIKRSPRT